MHLDPAAIDEIATRCACRNVGRAFTRLAGVLGMDRTTLTRNLEPLRRGGRWSAVQRDLQQLTALAGEDLSMEGDDS